MQAGFKAKRGAPKLTTIQHRLAVLSKAHQLKELVNPLRATEVQKTLRRVRRAYAMRGVSATPKPALTRSLLEAMLATCTDGIAGLCDRALLLFSWGSGGRRRSGHECHARESHATGPRHVCVSPAQIEDAAGGYRRESECLEADRGRGSAGTHAMVGDCEDHERTDLSAHSQLCGDQAVRHMKRRAALAGLAETGFSAHSLRSGFMTQAGRNKMHLGDAMALSDHRSVAMAMRYFQAGAGTSTGAQELLNGLTLPSSIVDTE